MSVNFMTRQRTVAAANTFGHIHDQQIHAVDDAGFDLTACGKQ